MCAKMGRPTDDPKNERINVRVTKDDKKLLEECCKILGQTQHDVIMNGISLVYESIKK